jgi:hypothetical protein
VDITRKFSFGINLDDPWRYAGVDEPKSIIFPHLLSLSLRESGRFEKTEEETLVQHHQADPKSEADRASLALADSVKSAGADFVRCWFPWSYFEPTPIPSESLGSLESGSYERWPMDSLVNALSGQGVSMIPVLACGYQRMLPKGLSPDSGRETYIRRATLHARQLVRHYKVAVRTWQIENEPNWWVMHETGGWRSGAAWLEAGGFRDDLLNSLNDAVHEEDPKAVTVVNLEADELGKGAADYSRFCDVLGLDFYPNYKSPEPVDASVIGRAQGLAKEAGRPAFVMETGYPSGPTLLGYSEANQAKYVGDAMREAFHSDSVTGIGIWRYLDTSWHSFPPQENHFGLVDEDKGPKQGWLAYATSVKDLRG